MAVTRNRGLSRSHPTTPSVRYLCRGPSVTNPSRGPLQSVIGLSQGFVAGPPDSVTSLVAKRPPTSPMFLRHCHMVTRSPLPLCGLLPPLWCGVCSVGIPLAHSPLLVWGLVGLPPSALEDIHHYSEINASFCLKYVIGNV